MRADKRTVPGRASTLTFFPFLSFVSIPNLQPSHSLHPLRTLYHQKNTLQQLISKPLFTEQESHQSIKMRFQILAPAAFLAGLASAMPTNSSVRLPTPTPHIPTYILTCLITGHHLPPHRIRRQDCRLAHRRRVPQHCRAGPQVWPSIPSYAVLQNVKMIKN